MAIVVTTNMENFTDGQIVPPILFSREYLQVLSDRQRDRAWLQAEVVASVRCGWRVVRW
jgi:hypothetical protein